jgi:mRNA interferase MazF
MKTRPGEVWLADLGIAGKVRPVVIVSREEDDPPRALALYVPLTSQNRFSAYEVEVGQLPFLHQPSVANIQGLGSLPLTRLMQRLGCVSPELMERIKSAIRYAMEL